MDVRGRVILRIIQTIRNKLIPIFHFIKTIQKRLHLRLNSNCFWVKVQIFWLGRIKYLAILLKFIMVVISLQLYTLCFHSFFICDIIDYFLILRLDGEHSRGYCYRVILAVCPACILFWYYRISFRVLILMILVLLRWDLIFLFYIF